MELRPYQQQTYDDILNHWSNGVKNIMVVMPTGAGKTVLFSKAIELERIPCVAIAHRQELVSQMSLALARCGVRHRIIGAAKTVKMIVKIHMKELGETFYEANSPVAVAGIDTLIRRKENLAHWTKSVQLAIIDEAHHLLKANKWGEGARMFPNARLLGVTATPVRADGKGLGADNDSVFEVMVEGASMRYLIDNGYLTKYRIFAPPNDINMETVTISQTTGDYNQNQLRVAVKKSHIMGNVVADYLRLARGKLGITFATDVETATDIAAQFNAAGVPAAVVSAKTPDLERAEVIDRFRDRQLLQLVNVDLFGEGFDLPAIEVVSMARPTQSYALYSQQFGRGLRPLDGKTHAIIIDHVGNVKRHLLPDTHREWSLMPREKKKSGPADDALALKACVECTGVYERIFKICPYCGKEDIPQRRDGAVYVDGDLCELDEATLTAMRGGVEAIDRGFDEVRAEAIAKHVPTIGVLATVNRHARNQAGQAELRESIAWWAGHQRHAGRNDSSSYRLFYLRFGVDVLSAQALKEKDAKALNLRVLGDLKK